VSLQFEHPRAGVVEIGAGLFLVVLFVAICRQRCASHHHPATTMGRPNPPVVSGPISPVHFKEKAETLHPHAVHSPTAKVSPKNTSEHRWRAPVVNLTIIFRLQDLKAVKIDFAGGRRLSRFGALSTSQIQSPW
jgi:hypothetical protein